MKSGCSDGVGKEVCNRHGGGSRVVRDRPVRWTASLSQTCGPWDGDSPRKVLLPCHRLDVCETLLVLESPCLLQISFADLQSTVL